MLFLLAHAGHAEHGFSAGFLHPIMSPDHLVAAVAVGVLATRLSGEPASRSAAIEWRAGSPAKRFALPLAFVIGMTIGGVLARLGVALPDVELSIALSLVALGIALALRKAGPTPIAAGALAILAGFHGHAHVAEYEATTGLLGYAVGLVVATALLHGAGLGLAMSVDRIQLPRVAFTRTAGVATLAFGVLKIVGIA